MLPIGWVPHGVACNHVVGSAGSDRHARLHIAASRLRIHHVANTCAMLLDVTASQAMPPASLAPKPLLWRRKT